MRIWYKIFTSKELDGLFEDYVIYIFFQSLGIPSHDP